MNNAIFKARQSLAGSFLQLPVVMFGWAMFVSMIVSGVALVTKDAHLSVYQLFNTGISLYVPFLYETYTWAVGELK